MWDTKASGPNTIGYRFSASATLLNHLAVCQYQSSTVKSTALHDPACTLKKTDTSAAGTSARGRTLQCTISLAMLSHLPFVNIQAGVPDPSSSAGSPMVLSPLILTQSRPASPSLLLPDSMPATTLYEQPSEGAAANTLLQQTL